MESGHPSHVHETDIQDMTMDGVMVDPNPGDRCPVIDLGQAEYGAVYQLQKKIHGRRVKGELSDVVLLVEHPPTFTIGRSGSADNVLISKERLEKENISLFFIERGGDVTYHGPGQLVVYPIFDLSKRDKDIRRYVRDLEEVMIRTLEDFSIRGCRDESHAGVWVNGEEIGAIGISVRKWISMHGVALNVDPVMEHFSYINPCGFVDRRATSMSEVLGRKISPEEVKARFLFHFSDVFKLNMEPQTLSEFERHEEKGSLPAWFKKKLPDPGPMKNMETLLEGLNLHTICESAHCPNMGECFARKTATFLILGEVCTRQCTFCAVKKGIPEDLDESEPQHLVEAVKKLGLRYVVITSVTRDDLMDGGAFHFAETIRLLHEQAGGVLVEVLVPDFSGSTEALRQVVLAAPEVLNHNLETVPRLYSKVRPIAEYERSLRLLREVKQMDPTIVTKSGLMLGLGEKREEVIQVMKDLRKADCDLLTIGQYLRPSTKHHPVVSFVSPEEFSKYEQIGRDLGFAEVAFAPLVRSSYKAAELYAKVKGNRG